MNARTPRNQACSRSPHNLGREEIRNLFQTEQHTADGSSESDCDTSCTSRTQYLATLSWYSEIQTGKAVRESNNLTFIVLVLCEVPTDNVTDATGNVDEWTFFTERETPME